MGAVLLRYYDKAMEQSGLAAKVKLAMITKMSSAQAKDAPDSPENIKLFEDALTKL